MSIEIYNSLTRKKEPFVPLTPPAVNLYTCGVTVYDDCHIGHARSLYVFDVIRRYLQYRGFKVNFVRNITDIDDKIINRANELALDWQELVETYIAKYYHDLQGLGVKRADFEPRATENIPEMITYIKGLVDKGYAYPTQSGVYFSVRKYKGYGELSGQGIEQMLSGVRKEPDEQKEDPLDFALWKTSKPNEPSWESPWGKGRPGWHIECSVMSQKFLKTDTLDIHAGGRDLIFPHHENEIAQAQALTGQPFARYWIHHGLLTINGQKMSKSLGNFVTIEDFLSKYQSADFLKLFFLSAHYSHPIDYTEEKITEAKGAFQRIAILQEKISRKVSDGTLNAGSEKIKEIQTIKEKFLRAMDDDFNTPQALAAVFELVNSANKHIEEREFLVQAHALLEELSDVLGLSLKVSLQKAMMSDDEINVKLSQRQRARRNKDFALSDTIRKELEGQGVILEDTKEGTTWRRKL